MRPLRPVPPLPRPLVVGLVVVLGGCVSSGARWDRADLYLDTAAVAPETAATTPAPTCRNGRGRVDDRLWRERVGTFEGRPYRDRATFRAAKQDLLRDLAAIRDRACAWEMRFVDDLVARVQARTWKDAGPRA
jgi:hypothetical protein